MSEDIYRQLPAQALALGPPLAYHDNGRGRVVLWGVRAAAAHLLTGAVAASVAVLIGLRALLRGGGDVTAGVELIFALSVILGVWFLIRAAWVVARSLRASAHLRGVVSFPKGMACLLRPERVLVIPWDEVAEIRPNGPTVRTAAGAEVVLPPSLKGWSALSEALLRETFHRLYTVAVVTVACGKSVSFGPVTVREDGLAVGDVVVAWGAIADVAFARGYLKLRRTDAPRPVVIPVAEVPNWHVLWALIERGHSGQPWSAIARRREEAE
jgi:hypothetical protein